MSSQSFDSLLTASIKLKTDTEKVNLLYKEGFKIRNTDPQFSFECAKAGSELAAKSRSKKHIAKICNLFGVLYYKKGDFKKALAYHQKALKLRIECGDMLGIAFSQTNLGNLYTDLKQFIKAETAYLDALDKYNYLKDAGRSIDCLNNIGVLKKNMLQCDAAIESFSFALKMAGEINDYEAKAICLNNLAITAGLKGDVEKAIAWNEDALKIRIMTDNVVEAADSYLNLVPLYIFQKDIAKAKQYLDTAFYIGNKYDYFEIKYKAFRNFATYYSEIKDYQAAYYWLKKYNDTKDSIAVQNGNAPAYDFNEGSSLISAKKNGGQFPYLFFNCLIIIAIFIIGFVFKFKR